MALETTPAAPFLKWAGGKGQLLEQYRAFFPARVETYYEPFVGSAAVFFHLQAQGIARRYVLSDVNADLINVYRVVRDDLESLLTLLGEHQARHSAEYFYTVRALDRDPGWKDTPAVVRAARMIYLNRTCYNGLWRVNSGGYFNAPMGRYQNPTILDAPRLRAASAALQGAEVVVRDFKAAVQEAQAGDFVYFDPPYYPLSATANFTSYAKDDFGVDQQQALAQVFHDLHVRGCRVMLSNSDTPLIRALYRDFRIETVYARRLINSRAEKRGPISEVVVLNYDW